MKDVMTMSLSDMMGDHADAAKPVIKMVISNVPEEIIPHLVDLMRLIFTEGRILGSREVKAIYKKYTIIRQEGTNARDPNNSKI